MQSRHRHRRQSGEEDEDGGLGRGSQSEALEGRSTPPPRPPLAGAIISHCIAPGLVFTDPSNPTRHRAEPFTHFVLFIPHPGPGRVLPTSQVGQLGLSEVSALAPSRAAHQGQNPGSSPDPPDFPAQVPHLCPTLRSGHVPGAASSSARQPSRDRVLTIEVPEASCPQLLSRVREGAALGASAGSPGGWGWSSARVPPAGSRWPRHACPFLLSGCGLSGRGGLDTGSTLMDPMWTLRVGTVFSQGQRLPGNPLAR